VTDTTKWTTVVTPSARRDLRSLPQQTVLRILRRIALLELDPEGKPSTALVGIPGYRRLRVGGYRVIYTLDHNRVVIVVVAVGHRSQIYQQRING
jgi:mRNA interferase RelE/StbE